MLGMLGLINNQSKKFIENKSSSLLTLKRFYTKKCEKVDSDEGHFINGD